VLIRIVKGFLMLIHNVYFTLKDSSQAAIDGLVADCYLYLTDHPGVVFFSAGVLAKELDRPVNDLDFQVGLHVVFETLEDQNQYQQHEKHIEFLEKNKDNWEKVRVFDSVSE
jgi:hypothetical protein